MFKSRIGNAATIAHGKNIGDIPEEILAEQVQKHLMMLPVDKYKSQLRTMDFYFRRKSYI